MIRLLQGIVLVLCLIFPLSCTNQPADDNPSPPPPPRFVNQLGIRFPPGQQWTSWTIPPTRAPYNTVEGLCLNAEYFVPHERARRGTGRVCLSDLSNRGVGEDFVIATFEVVFDPTNRFIAQLDCALRTSTTTAGRLTRHVNPHHFICEPEVEGMRTFSATGRFAPAKGQTNLIVTCAFFTIDTGSNGIGDTLPILNDCCEEPCNCDPNLGHQRTYAMRIKMN